MKEFTPPLSERSNTELLIIANSSIDDWQQKAIDLAKIELSKRGLSNKDQLNQFKEIDQLRKEGLEALMESRKREDFEPLEMVIILLFWPKMLFYDWSLRKHGYILKANRRIQLLLIGSISTMTLLATTTLTHSNELSIEEQQRLKAIEQIDISDWKKEHGYE